MSKKLPKKTKKPTSVNVRDIHPTTLKALNKMGQARHDTLIVFVRALQSSVDMLDSRLRTLKAWETMQDAMEEARSAPAEEPLRAGDYVYLTRGHTFDAFHDTIVRVKWVYPNGSPGFDHPASATGGDATAGMWRRATPAEIADHKAKEEQRAKEEERAKEMAAPLEFGMKVRTTQGDGFVHGIYGDGCTHPTGRWWIAFPHNVLNHYARKDITIID